MRISVLTLEVYRLTLGLPKTAPAMGYRAFSLTWPASMQIYWNKKSVCIRKKFNSHRICLGHQHGRRFIVLGHQYGRRDVMSKHSIWARRSDLKSGSAPINNWLTHFCVNKWSTLFASETEQYKSQVNPRTVYLTYQSVHLLKLVLVKAFLYRLTWISCFLWWTEDEGKKKKLLHLQSWIHRELYSEALIYCNELCKLLCFLERPLE